MQRNYRSSPCGTKPEGSHYLPEAIYARARDTDSRKCSSIGTRSGGKQTRDKTALCDGSCSQQESLENLASCRYEAALRVRYRQLLDSPGKSDILIDGYITARLCRVQEETIARRQEEEFRISRRLTSSPICRAASLSVGPPRIPMTLP